MFAQRFAATRLGARRARCVAAHQVHDWGIPHGTPLAHDVALLVAELAANAVLHGRVPGRGFELRLAYEHETSVVRVDAADTHPTLPEPKTIAADLDRGRGLHLVAAVAARWGVAERTGPGKTVWAETEPQRLGGLTEVSRRAEGV
ncbi:ATP-binding protein [Streptomyces apocyni]|uniref:ATP-binding protein n=1 Tax=Streptomyces apocyni TaxID=2654677 RepID=UPI0012EA3F1D|nr:ATP-binding protein [Streptomyces apocyni]